jgi:RimJ/RimL family protein N-acetyltransferase
MPQLHFPDPPLTDGVVLLRPWTDQDVAVVTAAVQDPLIAKHTRVLENQTEEQTRAFFRTQEPARRAGESIAFAIEEVATGLFAGTVGLLRFSWEEHRGEVGYWLAPEGRGRGLATRAVRLVAPWAIGELGLGRLALHTDIDNEGSQRVAERAGFTREGVLRAFEERKGERYDMVIFSLLPTDLD